MGAKSVTAFVAVALIGLLSVSPALAEIVPAEGDVIPAREIHGKHLGQISGTVAGPFGGPCAAAPEMPPAQDTNEYLFTYVGDAASTEYEFGDVTVPHNCRAGVYAGDGDEFLHPIYLEPGSYSVGYYRMHEVMDCCDLVKGYYQSLENQAESYLDIETVHFKVIDPVVNRFTADEKLKFSRRAAILSGDGALAAAVSGACLVTVIGAPCSIISGLEAAALGVAAGYYSYLAADPPSRHFRQLPKARIPSLPAIRAGNGMSRAVAAAATDLQKDYARESGLSRALMEAVDRSQGAAKARRQSFVRRQLGAAARTARRLAAALDDASRLRLRLRSAMKAAGLPDYPAGAANLHAVQHEIYTGSPPAGLSSTLDAFGLGQSRRKNVLSRLEITTPKTILPGIYALLADPQRRASDRQTASTLRKFARRAGRSARPVRA